MTSTNPLIELNRKLTGLTVSMREVPTRAVLAAALIVERTVSHQISVDAPRRRVAGGSVGVTHKTLSIGENASVEVRATGPLHLLANPTAPHTIAARHAQALSTPYGPRYSVAHPGTRGKNTWQKGVDQARPLILAAADEAAVVAVRAAFR